VAKEIEFCSMEARGGETSIRGEEGRSSTSGKEGIGIILGGPILSKNEEE